MFLKSLTLKGFKSFAEATTVEFEPGVTVVVGPNGSGKSNLVDAVAWVMGAQGPRSMRSGRMDDVIFAGTATRPALGRAEVALTIDNSSGRLPVGLAEVTVKRTLFRSGDSEYAINGAPCRLLDVQELLSNAGMGRQQHVIVGQGQLDEVLEARPEDRRLLLEEAAGVLKFRRRRERAERRLESTTADLERVSDLLREVRRQIRPLERQAEATRRHEQLATELRALRLYAAGVDLARFEARGQALSADLVAVTDQEREVLEGLSRLDEESEEVGEALGRHRVNDLGSLLGRVDALRARAGGLKAVVAERRRWAEAALAGPPDGDGEAALVQEQETVTAALAEAETAGRQVEEELAGLAHAEQELRDALAPFLAEGLAASGAREEDEASELRSRLAALGRGVERDQAELRRRADHRREREERNQALAGRMAAERANLEERRAEERSLEQAATAAQSALTEAERQVASVKDRLRHHQQEQQSWAGRAEALASALEEVRSRGGHTRLAGQPGVLGSLLDLVDVDPGWDAAVTAALGDAGPAVVVEGAAEALSAADHLDRSELPGTVLSLRSEEVAWPGPRMSPPPGPSVADLEAVRPHVRGASAKVEDLLDLLLERAMVADDWRTAARLSGADPSLVVVTRAGDRFSRFGWRFRGEAQPVTGARWAEAERRAAEAQEAVTALLDEVRRADGELARATEQWTATDRALRDRRAELHEASARLERLESELDTGTRLADDARRELALVEARLAADREEMAGLEVILADYQAGESERLQRRAEQEAERQRLDDRAHALRARRAELEVSAGRSKERHELLTGRLADLESRRRSLADRRQAEIERRQGLELTVATTGRLGPLVERCLEQLALVQSDLSQKQSAHRQQVAVLGHRLDELRQQRDAAEQSLTQLRERARRLELDHAEVRLRAEAVVESLGRELDVSAEEARSAEAPELPPGTTTAQRIRELDRELRLLGPVNPLAVTELDALSERSTFLEGQLEDVRSSRRELGQVIRSIDAEIMDVFAGTYADTAGHFEQLCTTLFPGGMGRLRLTDPDDLLRTGVDIEARPAGKQVRRLSLLSGGERSLVALAFLFAVFRSRPSPFYLMDEVEAALDDVNLMSFLELVKGFRDEAQLILVTHQKRTMEAGDCLYGITMRPGEPSQVVSEKVGARV